MERRLRFGPGVEMAVRKECVGRGLAMWIAWVAAGCRQRVGREICPKRWSTANDSGLSREDWQGAVGAEDSDLGGIDGSVAGLACSPGKCGGVESV